MAYTSILVALPGAFHSAKWHRQIEQLVEFAGSAVRIALLPMPSGRLSQAALSGQHGTTLNDAEAIRDAMSNGGFHTNGLAGR
jgi:hypothetical protein